jgi:virulence-associated protein VagC
LYIHREAKNQAANRWRTFFENTALPTEDFMSERVDLPPQTRELF